MSRASAITSFVIAFAIAVPLAAAADAPSPPASSPPVTLSALVDRYVAWRGGGAYEQLQSIHYSGALDAGGVRQTDDIWMGRDGRTREDLDRGLGKLTSVAGPDGAWDTNLSGQVLDNPGAALTARRHALLEFGDALSGRNGATAVLAGTEQAGGHNWSVVRVSFGDADTYDVFIDPTTGALAGYRIVENGQPSVVNFGDWRLVDGVRMPFARVTQFDGGAVVMKMTAIELNGPPDSSLFARPSTARRASFKDGAASTGWINFDLQAETRIYLPVKVNGHDAVALLDSGATASIIDRAYAASIGLGPAGGGVPISGINGSGGAGTIPGVTIEVGNLTLKDLTVASLDTGPLTKMTGRPMPLILGDEAFNELVVDIDFVHRRIAFRDPASLAKPADAAELPLVRNGNNRLTAVSIEGRPPVQVAFDLGDADTLDVFPAYAAAAKLLDGRRTSQELLGGIGGVRTQTVEVLRQVDFGGVELTEVPADFPPLQVHTIYSNQIQGSLGVGILSRFRLMIDYSHDHLYALPNADAAAAPFVKDRLGLHGLQDGEDLVVLLAAPNSPTAAAGVKAGDRIARIDGKPISDWPLEGRARLADGPAGTQVLLTFEGGATKTVTLADYY